MRLFVGIIKHCVRRSASQGKNWKLRSAVLVQCWLEARMLVDTIVVEKLSLFCLLWAYCLPKKLTQSWTNERVTTYLMTSLIQTWERKLTLTDWHFSLSWQKTEFSCISFSLIFSLFYCRQKYFQTTGCANKFWLSY